MLLQEIDKFRIWIRVKYTHFFISNGIKGHKRSSNSYNNVSWGLVKTSKRKNSVERRLEEEKKVPPLLDYNIDIQPVGQFNQSTQLQLVFLPLLAINYPQANCLIWFIVETWVTTTLSKSTMLLVWSTPNPYRRFHICLILCKTCLIIFFFERKKICLIFRSTLQRLWNYLNKVS